MALGFRCEVTLWLTVEDRKVYCTPPMSCGWSPNFTVQEVREAQVSFAGVV
jgi:hypothetical protein